MQADGRVLQQQPGPEATDPGALGRGLECANEEGTKEINIRIPGTSPVGFRDGAAKRVSFL